MASKTYMFDLSPVEQFLPKPTQLTGCLNPTAIGKQLGIKAVDVNKILESMDFQRKENGSWRMNPVGFEYGEEAPYTRNNHSGWQIRWNEKVIPVVKSQLINNRQMTSTVT